jgi:ATP-dependent Clp protease ATP-binding subunit ClpA
MKAKDPETKLHRLVIGQDEALHEIVRIHQTYLAGLAPEGRPIGSFLFLGPTGTGKTRAVEAAAEALLGNPRAGIQIAGRKFTPEFLNRLNKIVVFRALGNEELNGIVESPSLKVCGTNWVIAA